MTHSKCRMVPSWRSVSSPSSPPSSSSSTSSSWPGVFLQACGHLESSIFLFPDQWGTDVGRHQVLCRYFNVKCFRRPFRNPPYCHNTWSQPNMIFYKLIMICFCEATEFFQYFVIAFLFVRRLIFFNIVDGKRNNLQLTRSALSNLISLLKQGRKQFSNVKKAQCQQNLKHKGQRQ